MHPELDDLRWLRRRWNAGDDAEAIAERLGCDVVAARLALVGAGLLRYNTEPPKRRGGSHIRDRSAGDLDPRLTDADFLRRRYLAEGATVRAIADELGCTEVDVRNALVASDVRERRPRRAEQRGT